MKRCAVAFAAFMLVSHTSAEPLEVAPEHQEAIQKAAMGLVFADGCEKALDETGMVEPATSILAEAYRAAGLDDHTTLATEAARAVREAPQKPDDGPFTFFNPTMCAQVKAGLEKQASE